MITDAICAEQTQTLTAMLSQVEIQTPQESYWEKSVVAVPPRMSLPLSRENDDTVYATYEGLHDTVLNDPSTASTDAATVSTCEYTT